MSTRTSGGIMHTLVLLVALVLFATPMVAAAIFGFTLPGQGFTLESLVRLFDNPRALESIVTTLEIATLSTVLALALLLPTQLYLHLKAPGLRRAAESLSVFPLVVPAVALVSGVGIFFRAVWPAFLVSPFSLVPLYVIVSLPLVYRALDAGVEALDLRTLWTASASLGATPWQTLIRVVFPNLRSALLSAGLLCFTMALSEFALASLLLHYTFPVFTVEVGGQQPRGAAALSFMTIVVTWLLLIMIAAASARGPHAPRQRRTPWSRRGRTTAVGAEGDHPALTPERTHAHA